MKSMKVFYAIIAMVSVGMLTSCSTDGESVYVGDGLNSSNEGIYGEVPMPGGNRFDVVEENPFVNTKDAPVSTFSIDADGASYGIMRRLLADGYDVPKNSIRTEEYLNYFTFDYQAPTGNHAAAINAEIGPCPWNEEHQLLRLGIKGKELAENEVPLANYVFLVDVSGSMAGYDRLGMLKTGLKHLLSKMNPNDRISLITYSGEVQKLLESTPVKEFPKIEEAINKLSAYGSTAGGEAMKMAYEEALANYDPEKNNRVIMGTDGDFNVGVTDTKELLDMVKTYAGKGIYLTCLGFGIGNLNDSMMEQVSNAGNGTYNYIDCENEIMKVFVHERERFVSVANDAKCQITFDSTLVSAYRLIGYENRMMSSEDFEDDTKDAGEIGAGQTITALYEIVPASKEQANPNQTLATFDFRYKKSLDGSSLSLKREIRFEEMNSGHERTPDFYFAAGVAVHGMVLRDSQYKGNATSEMAEKLVEAGLEFDPHGYRAELLQLIRKINAK